MDKISDNLLEIKNKIAQAAEKSGRKKEDITLIGVTKTIDVKRIEQLVGLGVTNLGENKAQEMNEKYSVLGGGINWHMIGHLQTNKVKYIIDKAYLIHSVDNLKLAVEIDKRAAVINKTQDILVEINIASEPTKHGVLPQEALLLSGQILKFHNLRLRGIMCVAPFVEKSSENRIYFQNMRKIFIDIRTKINDNVFIDCLSMGMTNDYETAIEEGSTMVRIGTGIFGARY